MFNFYMPGPHEKAPIPAPTVADMYAMVRGRSDIITCGRKAAGPGVMMAPAANTRRHKHVASTMVALHLRVGDLFGRPCTAAKGPSQKWCKKNIRPNNTNPMLGNTAHFLANQLKILSAIAADPKNGHVMPKLHIVLVSDSKIDIVNTVLKPAGISLKQVRATHADGALIIIGRLAVTLLKPSLLQ